MAAKLTGDFRGMARKVRTGAELGMRDLTLLAKAEIQKQTPVNFGILRNKWASRFDRGALRGTVGNNTAYAQRVAEGRRRGRLSPKEKRNRGFHIRGANRAFRRTSQIMQRAMVRAGVPVR